METPQFMITTSTINKELNELREHFVHLDRHSNATEEEKKQEEMKFKECGEAYTVLSDNKKKARYDSGQDLDDAGGGFGKLKYYG